MSRLWQHDPRAFTAAFAAMGTDAAPSAVTPPR